MKLWINIETDYAASAETEIEVPDGSTAEQINEVVDGLARGCKLNFPSIGKAEKFCSTLTVHRVLANGEPEDEAMEECEKSW
jgi:hypothetical protein